LKGLCQVYWSSRPWQKNWRNASAWF